MARILIVEDEKDLASGLKDDLEFEGYEIEIELKKDNYDEWSQKFTVSDHIRLNPNLRLSAKYREEMAARAKAREEEPVVVDDEGGTSVWWYIGGGVVVAGAAAVLLSQSGGDSQDPPVTTDQGFPAPPGRP